MMYSPHQMIPTLPGDPFQGSYNGKPFPESGLERWALTDQQKAFLEQDHIRHVLVMKLESAGIAAGGAMPSSRQRRNCPGVFR